MLRFWKRIRGHDVLAYRARHYPAWTLMQHGRYQWYLGLDPEAPVEHEELLYALDTGERYNLFQRPFTTPRQARRGLSYAMRVG